MSESNPVDRSKDFEEFVKHRYPSMSLEKDNAEYVDPKTAAMYRGYCKGVEGALESFNKHLYSSFVVAKHVHGKYQFIRQPFVHTHAKKAIEEAQTLLKSHPESSFFVFGKIARVTS